MSARKLDQLLRTTPAVYATLEDALLRPTTGPGAERVSGGGGDDKPAPLQLQVAEHRHTGLRGLRWWVARLGLELDQQPPATLGEHPAGMCAWLLSLADQLDPDTAGELADNLASWQRRARVLTDLPELRTTLPLPERCPAGGELWDCPGNLRVNLPADRGRTAWVTCPSCRARWEVTELPQAADVRLPVHVVAELLGVTVRTVQRRTERDDGMVRLGDALQPCAL